MHRFIAIIVLTVLTHGLGRAQAQWEKTALPVDARVNVLTTSGSMIVAGTNGEGIFASSDWGEHWRAANNGLESKVIHAIFIHGTTLFAGTNAGVSVSHDSGMSWSPGNAGLPREGVWSFAERSKHPLDSTLFAGTWSGVYRSSNNGRSWESLLIPQTRMPVHSLAVSNEIIFAATVGAGMFSSKNWGIKWDTISVIDADQYGNRGIIPVHALIAFDTLIVASVGSGYFYTMPYNSPYWSASQRIASFPILCFAIHDRVLFSGNSYGSVYSSLLVKWLWNTDYFSIGYENVYSVAVTDSYIFAGTDNGLWRMSNPSSPARLAAPAEVPRECALEQNYPNPFNPSTTISFSVPSNVFVSVKVFDLMGKEVATLASEAMAPGRYSRVWNAASMPSGMYFYRLQAGVYNETKRLILVR